MDQKEYPDPGTSPFHRGEREIQERVGKREIMARFGSRVIRPFMPDQHRSFFAQIPFLVAGSVDEAGWPWASFIWGKPGFAQSPEPTVLTVNGATAAGDPLAAAIRPGQPLGLLGIELETRRRNRVNGRIEQAGEGGFSLQVDQSFGNCPQYIQTRDVVWADEKNEDQPAREAIPLQELDVAARQLIANADTFFVASYVQRKNQPRIEGVDVSHRGGQRGFVKVAGNSLTVPDFSGNNHFNTLGNFLVNPKAGLLFADFQSGDLLMLTGEVEILWEDAPEVKAFAGAERAWRFQLSQGLRLPGAFPFTTSLREISPNTLMTGNWQQAETALATAHAARKWQPLCVTQVVDESDTIRSFYLQPALGQELMPFKAGQFLPIKVKLPDSPKPMVRTYTLSCAPGSPHYRISVKREPAGKVSKYLHQTLKVGSLLEARAPRGHFFLDPAVPRPAVLIAAGVGITPMIAMAQQVFGHSHANGQLRPLTILHAAKTTRQRAFCSAFRRLETESGGKVRYFSWISQPTNGEKTGIDFDFAGRITAAGLRHTLPLDNYDFYLCGPASFMQSIYTILRELGVADLRIFAEAFGPASLTRTPDQASTVNETLHEAAAEALVQFSQSKFEQRWHPKDGTLLELAEAHGLTPEAGCRGGACGSCAVRLLAGEVAYAVKPTAKPEEGSVLICSAVPAKGSDTIAIEL